MAIKDLIGKTPPPPKPRIIKELKVSARLAADIEKVRKILRVKAKRKRTFEEVLLQLADEGLGSFRRWEQAQQEKEQPQ